MEIHCNKIMAAAQCTIELRTETLIPDEMVSPLKVNGIMGDVFVEAKVLAKGTYTAHTSYHHPRIIVSD